MDTDTNQLNGTKSSSDFVVSDRPVVSPLQIRTEDEAGGGLSRYENLGELPRSYGQPVLFAIARDPKTIFTYWDIDWSRIFADNPPQDQKVILRLLATDGTEQGKSVVEPLAANCCLAVPHAGAAYQVELGFVDRAGIWNSVAKAESIEVPVDGIADDLAIDVVTIPLHLHFQRIVDLFRASKYDGQALSEVLANLQTRSIDSGGTSPLTTEEEELLRATNWQITEREVNLRENFQAQASEDLDQRLGKILGFGPSSSQNGFDGSSRA
jgi:hypothetical protein